MKPRLIIILVILTVTPLVAVAVLGVRLARGERAVTEQRLRVLLESKLATVDERISQLVRDYEDRLGLAAGAGRGVPAVAADVLNRFPEVAVFFAIDGEGNLTVPLPPDYEGPVDQAFLSAVHNRWRTAQDAPVPTGKGAAPQEAIQQRGWHTWYWNEGLQMLFWWRLPDDGIAGVHLRRARFLADVVAVLPDTSPGDASWANARVVLRDAQGSAIYPWGMYEPADDAAPHASLALSPPLGAWRLDYYAAPEALALPQRSLVFNLIAGLTALAVMLIALATYFYRESTRAARDAAQRVTFVNQVSHELKTPLTNIRMYAELLEDELEGNETASRRLKVIVLESQRLSRLIGNVLTFGRHRRSELSLHRHAGVVDDIVRRVVERVRPGLTERGIACELALAASSQVLLDADAVEQILGNLLSNVEKYAAGASQVIIETGQANGRTTVMVHDDGPGIPRGAEDRIFEPFYRCHDRLSDGVAGTGIGLSIARDLARLHGGDLTASNEGRGAAFLLTIETPPTEGIGA